MPVSSRYTSNVVLLGQDKTAASWKSAAGGADKLQRKFSGVSIAAAGVGVAVAGLTVGLALATKRALDHADAIAKQADATGLSTDALQEYRHAASLSGVATEQLDTALLQFTKRIGEARADTGSLVEFLDKYDSSMVSALQATRNTDEALDLVLNTMAGMESQTDRAALAAAAFGRSGVALTNIVRDGAGGLAEMRDEAQRLGLVIPESMTRQAEAANDALNRMGRIVGVSLDKVLISLAPTIEAVGTAFAAAAPHIARFVESMAAAIGGIELLSIEGLRRELMALDADIKDMQDTIDTGVGESMMAASMSIEQLKKERADVAALLEDREAELKMVQDLADAHGDRGAAADAASKAELAAGERLLQSLTDQAAQLGMTQEEQLRFRLDKTLGAITAAELTFEQRTDARIAAVQIFHDELAAVQITAQERAELAAQDHLARMQQMELEHQEITKALWASGMDGKLQIVGDVLGQLAALQDSKSKAMFKVGQLAAIAETTINTYRSATAAYAALAGIPVIGPALGAAAAAAAIAAGLANVQAIRSQQFGGGGGGGFHVPQAPSPGIQVPAAPPPPDLDGQAGGQKTLFLNIESEAGLFTDEQLRDILRRLGDLISDGYDLRVA